MAPDEPAAILNPDVILLPLIGFDLQGNRVGFGRGYYDFSIAHLKQTRNILSIGLGYDIQKVGHVPAHTHDQPVDAVATESKVYKFKVNNR